MWAFRKAVREIPSWLRVKSARFSSEVISNQTAALFNSRPCTVAQAHCQTRSRNAVSRADAALRRATAAATAAVEQAQGDLSRAGQLARDVQPLLKKAGAVFAALSRTDPTAHVAGALAMLKAVTHRFDDLIDKQAHNLYESLAKIVEQVSHE